MFQSLDEWKNRLAETGCKIRHVQEAGIKEAGSSWMGVGAIEIADN